MEININSENYEKLCNVIRDMRAQFLFKNIYKKNLHSFLWHFDTLPTTINRLHYFANFPLTKFVLNLKDRQTRSNAEIMTSTTVMQVSNNNSD